jgi:hypothetical protein
VNPPEYRWIQTRLQLVQRPIVRRPGHRVCYYDYRIVDQRGVHHFLGLNQHETLPHTNRQLVPPALARLHRLDDTFEIGR